MLIRSKDLIHQVQDQTQTPTDSFHVPALLGSLIRYQPKVRVDESLQKYADKIPASLCNHFNTEFRIDFQFIIFMKDNAHYY